jgi:non-specific serine/threonine protein kinase
MSPDPGDTYFCDGLTEEIITNLSHLHSLRVISRSSAMVLKSTLKDVRTIGRELDVQYVLEGSVRRSGNDLRITAQLIDARTDEHLWAERYEGTLDDVFMIQEEASHAIVEALDVKINPGEREKLVERPIEDIRAYECYLRARNDFHRGTTESLKSALRHLEAGLEIVGENELLYQGMAEVHLQNYEYGVKADEETLQQAEKFCAKVMALRPDSANSHYLNGRIERFRGSCVRAAQHFERALEIDPNHPGALAFLVVSYAFQVGRPSAADTFATRLVAVDPLSPLVMIVLAWHHWMSGRFDEALSTFNRALELEPDFVWASVFGVAYILMWQERRDEALKVLAPIACRDPRDYAAEWAILLESALAEDSAGVAEALSVDTKNFLWNDPDVLPFIGSAYALAGAREEALTWLERAIERGWINYPLFSTQDPFYESIRGEERFKELMVEVKARWEAFEA